MFPTNDGLRDQVERQREYERRRFRHKIITKVGGVENLPESGRWCVVHDKPADGYGLCYRVDEEKPPVDCRSVKL